MQQFPISKAHYQEAFLEHLMEGPGESLTTSKQDAKYQRAVQQIRTVLAFKHLKNDREPAMISEGLYLGSIGAAMSKETLTRLGISHVLTVADNITPLFPALFTYRVLAILDTETSNLTEVLDETYEFIDSALEAGHRVLVHW